MTYALLVLALWGGWGIFTKVAVEDLQGTGGRRGGRTTSWGSSPGRTLPWGWAIMSFGDAEFSLA